MLAPEPADCSGLILIKSAQGHVSLTADPVKDNRCIGRLWEHMTTSEIRLSTATAEASRVKLMTSHDSGGQIGGSALSSAKSDKFTLLLTSGAIILLFAVGAATQSAMIYQLSASGNFSAADGIGTLAPRLFANLICVSLALVLTWFIAPERHRRMSLLFRIAFIALIAGGVRTALQMVGGLYPLGTQSAVLVDLAAGVTVVVLSLTLGIVFVSSARRLRVQELANVQQGLKAAAALAALQSEELRVRRDVAEGLHGTLQQRLVLVSLGLAHTVERIKSEVPIHAAEGSQLSSIAASIRSIRNELDDLREIDVRQMSQLLYPAGVDRGLEPAARMMVRRVPAPIDVHLLIDDAVRDIDATEPPSTEHRISRRILLLRVLEEAISNALRHGHASELVLRIRSDGPDGVMLTIDDNGVGLPDTKPTLNGLGLLAERVVALGGTFSLKPGPLGGSQLSAMVRFEASVKQPVKARH